MYTCSSTWKPRHGNTVNYVSRQSTSINYVIVVIVIVTSLTLSHVIAGCHGEDYCGRNLGHVIAIVGGILIVANIWDHGNVAELIVEP